MASRTLCIHAGRTDETVLLAPFHESQAIIVVINCVLGESLHENPIYFTLMNWKCSWALTFNQKVINLLIVDLEKWAIHEWRWLGCFILLFHKAEDMVNWSRDHPGVVTVCCYIFKESWLMRNLNWTVGSLLPFMDHVLPVVTEHGICLTYTIHFIQIPDPVWP
jgi:hypothetical protein